MIPLRLDIIQPMLLHTTILGSPVLHRLHIRYVKLLIIVLHPFDYILYIRHPPSNKRTSLLHFVTSYLTFCTSSDQCRQLLPLLPLLSCTRVQVISDVKVVDMKVICFCGLMHYGLSPLSQEKRGSRCDFAYSMTRVQEHALP